jgi:hypothetical protein
VVDNVEFLQGLLEEILLPDAIADDVISICVINLAADKSVVLRAAVRVLRPADGSQTPMSSLTPTSTTPVATPSGGGGSASLSGGHCRVGLRAEHERPPAWRGTDRRKPESSVG